ncbi:transcription factor bHLH112-like [Miscanthus floridulus]|uniref:transcription factor bHLH112-like n=1 Tax=Miscanthus floridulus TaxID=154761 RepID=UPI00345856DC
MADEWWSSTRTADDGGSPCSTAPATDQLDSAAPPSFLADPPHHMDWTQSYMGGRASVPAAEAATTSFNALLQLHGDVAGRHFLLGQQLHADGVAPVAAASQSASSLYAGGNQLYSSYGGDVPAAALMTKPPFTPQEFFGSSTRNLGDMPAAPPMTTKPLLLQALQQKAFKSHKEPAQDACSSATGSVPGSPVPAKKPRVATPSPLPTFKVRKEKLGDRITALQQLVSPFGKTDTASVLHEAIEYIRFLHDQVASLSSPYLRCGRPMQQLQQQQVKDGDEAKEDLRSRGLCVVPVASTTYAVAASETVPAEFWPPTFGGTLR